MICNEPPWYPVMRRRRLISKWWPLILVGIICGVEFLAATIAALR